MGFVAKREVLDDIRVSHEAVPLIERFCGMGWSAMWAIYAFGQPLGRVYLYAVNCAAEPASTDRRRRP